MSNVFHDADELIQAELPAYEPPPAWIPPEHVKYLFVFAFGCMQQVFRHVRMFVSIIAHFPRDSLIGAGLPSRGWQQTYKELRQITSHFMDISYIKNDNLGKKDS